MARVQFVSTTLGAFWRTALCPDQSLNSVAVRYN